MSHKMRLHLARIFLRWHQRRWPVRPLSELRPAAIKRLLVINATALGDLLFSTPAIQGLSECFPDRQLDLLLQPGLLPLMAPDSRIYRCWGYPTGGLGLWRLARELRQQQYDLVVILHGNDPEATLLARLTRAPFVIGSAHSPLRFAYSAAVSRQGLGEHAIARRLNLVRPLGVKVTERQMKIVVPDEVRQQARAAISRYFQGWPSPLVALHPGGSDAYKRWPLERFGELAAWLSRTHGARFLIIGSAAERELGESLAQQAGVPALVTGGRFDLLMVAGLLSHCNLLVGNDSGPFHLGLALRIPSIGLLGADAPQRVGPYEAPWGQAIFKEEACPRDPCLTKSCPRTLCLAAIEVEDVKNLVQEWWEPAFWTQPEPGVRHA